MGLLDFLAPFSGLILTIGVFSVGLIGCEVLGWVSAIDLVLTVDFCLVTASDSVFLAAAFCFTFCEIVLAALSANRFFFHIPQADVSSV